MTLYAVPKPAKPLVSKAIRQSAEGRLCTVRWANCDGGGETTVLAHLRIGCFVAGIGQKPADWFAVYACAACHDDIDRRGPDRVPESALLRALHETQAILFSTGLITVRGS